jgi:hypothetical protein
MGSQIDALMDAKLECTCPDGSCDDECVGCAEIDPELSCLATLSWEELNRL